MALRDHGRRTGLVWACALYVMGAGVSASAATAATQQPDVPFDTDSNVPVGDRLTSHKYDAGSASGRGIPGSLSHSGGDVVSRLGRIDSLDIQFRRLGDQLAEGVKSRAGAGRYDRWAIMPFTELGPEVERHQLGELSTERLETALETDHGFFSIDRKKLMDVVREKQLLHVLVFEEGKIRQIGRAVGADVLVSGSVGYQGGRYVVNARAANVETGQVVAVARAEITTQAFNKAASSAVLRTRTLAALRSAALPGWGQWSNHQRIKGGIVLAASLTLLGFALRNVIVGYNAEQKYLAITKDNAGACQTVVSNSNQFNQCLHKQASGAIGYYQNANKFFIGLGALYVLNIVDAFVFGKNPDTANMLAPGTTSADTGGHSFNVGVGLQGLTLTGSF